MPGKYIDVVTVYQCGELPDGTAIMCTKFGWDKIPFLEPEFFDAENPLEVGWQEVGGNGVHIPLERLVMAMEQIGITVSYDEEELTRRLGPPPSAASESDSQDA